MSGKKQPTEPDGEASGGVLTEDELAAMKEHVQEVKARRKRGAKADEEPDVLAKIADMDEADRVLAERIHALVKEHAPSLTPRLWYGMPAYSQDGKVLCFFQAAGKFKARYATLGFSDVAQHDDGAMWPAAFAILDITPAEEERIADLLRRAVG